MRSASRSIPAISACLPPWRPFPGAPRRRRRSPRAAGQTAPTCTASRHPAGPPLPRALCRGASASSTASASASAPASRSGTRKPVRPWSTTAAMPPAGVATSGVADASDSITTFGRPSTFPASSRIEGTATTSAAASSVGISRLRHGSQEMHDVPGTGPRGARPQFMVEIAAAGDDQVRPRMRRTETSPSRRSGTRNPSCARDARP